MRTNDKLITDPGCVVDPASLDREQGRQIDWNAVSDEYRVGAFSVQTNGAVNNGATSITIDPAPKDIPQGSILSFPNNVFVKTTAAVATGATVVPVAAVTGTIADNAIGWLYGSGKKAIKAFQSMGIAGTSDGKKMAPRVAGSNPAVCLIETDAYEDSPEAAKTGYGTVVGGVFFENMMPDGIKNAGTLPTAIKNELAASGTGYRFLTHENSATTA